MPKKDASPWRLAAQLNHKIWHASHKKRGVRSSTWICWNFAFSACTDMNCFFSCHCSWKGKHIPVVKFLNGREMVVTPEKFTSDVPGTGVCKRTQVSHQAVFDHFLADLPCIDGVSLISFGAADCVNCRKDTMICCANPLPNLQAKIYLEDSSIERGRAKLILLTGLAPCHRSSNQCNIGRLPDWNCLSSDWLIWDIILLCRFRWSLRGPSPFINARLPPLPPPYPLIRTFPHWLNSDSFTFIKAI